MNGRFKIILEALGLTQKDIAQALDIKQPTVSDWVNDKREVPQRNAKILEEKYKINIDFLYNGEGEPLQPVNIESVDIHESISHYKTNNKKVEALLDIIVAQQQQIKDLLLKIKTLEDEAEATRQQKFNYRKSPTVKQQNELHNKGGPLTHKQQRFTPK